MPTLATRIRDCRQRWEAEPLDVCGLYWFELQGLLVAAEQRPPITPDCWDGDDAGRRQRAAYERGLEDGRTLSALAPFMDPPEHGTGEGPRATT